ncbi:YhgE/Pip family protein [Limosilactobacillus ingluviei]
MWEMIKAEFRHIWRNKLLRLSVFVVCFIPFLYSIFFLKSVWDPYGNTGDLPVAVVNKDVPVEYQGKTMAVGRDTVKELKKNKELKWEFVSAKKAHYGLRHRQYYTVVTIPKNFSQDATTVLNKHPQKMEVKYETNGSLNYIAEVISELGMNKLNQEIRYQVTKAYSKATFKALKAVGKGMTTAADGAGQLAGGTSTLNSGFAAYAAGVSQVNTGVQTLNSSVGALGSGASQLANGSGQLASGLREYTGGVGTLTGGLNTLNSKSSELNDGSGKLAAGAQELNQTVSASFGNIDFAKLNQFISGAPQMAAGLDQMKEAVATLSNLPSGNIDGSEISNTLGQIGQNDGTIAAIAKSLAESESDQGKKQQLQDIASRAQENVAFAQALGKKLTSLNETMAGLAPLKNINVQQAQATIAGAENLLSYLNENQKQLASLPDQAEKLQAATKQLSDGAATLNSGVSQYTAGVSQAAAGANQLAANSGQLTSGANTLASSLQMLNRQVPTLVAGVAKLAAGTAQLNANTPQLVNGITQLNAGAGELADKLAAGAKQVNSIRTSDKTADMIAKPTTLKHKSYSYVPNYGHALAPYVLSVAIYVGALVFNFVYPIRRVALQGRKASSWWASKVAIEALVALAMAVTEGGIMMALGLEVKHVPSFFLTLTLFAWASFALVMFLSMTFDNPGRFVAMVLLMLQLGGSGGTFPMEVTMKFYNVIHWYLPMTYSILGLRNGISGGLGEHYVAFCNSVLTGIIVVFVILSLLAMIWLQKHHFAGKSELDNNQELLGPEHDDDGMHLQDRDQTI